MSDKFAALVAAATYLVGAGIGFGWRMWWQWRKTGSTGFKGVSGRVGSADWFGGVGFVLGVVITAASPVLQLVGIVAPLLHSPWVHWSGVLIAAAGIAGIVHAQLAMGASWRIGVDAGETTTLVHTGVFGVVRNPIYVAMFVFWLGTTLIAPNIVAIVGYAVLVVSIEVQVRLVEEPYLLQVHGDGFREYASTVGRFAPRTGLIR